VEIYIKSSILEVEEFGYKLGFLVGSDMEWNFMFSLLEESINYDKDCVKARKG